MLSTSELVHWANAFRNIDNHDDRTRALDALWSGQLESKAWLVNQLNNYIMPRSKQNIYIFGGWIGILANMLLHNDWVDKVRSIDLDPWCEKIADDVNKIHEMNGWRFKAVTADMASYNYQSDIATDIVINTSCEHVSEVVYNEWFNKIPDGTLIVIQGNNFFECEEHIRCSASLSEFKLQNRVTGDSWSGSLETDMYIRYMSIWRK